MDFSLIISPQNPRVKNLVRLREANHRRRQQRFLIEGFREIKRASQRSWPIETLFFCPERFVDKTASFDLVEQIAESSECVQLGEEAFRKAAYREGPDGLLATAQTKNLNPADLPLPANAPLILILEALEKPGNLGAILRTANGGGIDAVIISNPVTDVFNPNVIRASQGALFDIPFAISDNETVQDFLERGKFTVHVTTPSADKVLWNADFSGKSAIVLGSEDQGLSEDWLNNDFLPVSIPMQGITDSLNVSATAAVLVFEALRQRRI